MKSAQISFILVLIGISSGVASASDEAFLDKPYRDLPHAERLTKTEALRRGLKNRSDVHALIKNQTPVKSQVSRGTCSIFSATAILESVLIQNGFKEDIDLSEEWLQYLIAQYRNDYGSTSSSNFYALIEHGISRESVMPYIGEEWSDASSGLAKTRCGHVPASRLASCLVGHNDPRLLNAKRDELLEQGGKFYNPEFLEARESAEKVRDDLIGTKASGQWVSRVDQVKGLLDAGVSVTLDIDFYYGAWNHRRTTQLGIERNMAHWKKGIVGYPEVGSDDYKNSPKERAGHSVVLVGYDDTVEVLGHKGVYYFKNSWGTEGFGAEFEIDDVAYPGYGMITQDYADEYGAYYRIVLE